MKTKHEPQAERKRRTQEHKYKSSPKDTSRRSPGKGGSHHSNTQRAQSGRRTRSGSRDGPLRQHSCSRRDSSSHERSHSSQDRSQQQPHRPWHFQHRGYQPQGRHWQGTSFSTTAARGRGRGFHQPSNNRGQGFRQGFLRNQSFRDRQQNLPFRDRQQNQPFRDRQQNQPFRDRQQNQPFRDKQQNQPFRDRQQNQLFRDRQQNQPFRDRLQQGPRQQGPRGRPNDRGGGGVGRPQWRNSPQASSSSQPQFRQAQRGTQRQALRGRNRPDQLGRGQTDQHGLLLQAAPDRKYRRLPPILLVRSKFTLAKLRGRGSYWGQRNRYRTATNRNLPSTTSTSDSPQPDPTSVEEVINDIVDSLKKLATFPQRNDPLMHTEISTEPSVSSSGTAAAGAVETLKKQESSQVPALAKAAGAKRKVRGSRWDELPAQTASDSVHDQEESESTKRKGGEQPGSSVSPDEVQPGPLSEGLLKIAGYASPVKGNASAPSESSDVPVKEASSSNASTKVKKKYFRSHSFEKAEADLSATPAPVPDRGTPAVAARADHTQQHTGQVTELFCGAGDDDGDIELIILPPASIKPRKSKQHQKPRADKSGENKPPKQPLAQNTQPVGLLPTPATSSVNSGADTEPGITAVIAPQLAEAQKEKSEHSSTAVDGKPQQQSAISDSVNKSASAERSLEKSASQGIPERPPSLEPTPHRRIVKVKTRPQALEIAAKARQSVSLPLSPELASSEKRPIASPLSSPTSGSSEKRPVKSPLASPIVGSSEKGLVKSPLASPIVGSSEKGPVKSPFSSPTSGSSEKRPVKSPFSLPAIGSLEKRPVKSPLNSPTVGSSEKSLIKSPLSSPTVGSSERRLVKIKSRRKSFKDILSGNTDEEDLTSSGVSAHSGGNDTDTVHDKEQGEQDTVSASVIVDETMSVDSVAEDTVSSDYDFSTFFPHSEAEKGQRSIDFITDKCSEVTLSSTERDRGAQQRKEEDWAYVRERSLSKPWRFEDPESGGCSGGDTEHQQSADDQPANLTIEDKSGLLEDISEGSECFADEESCSENAETITGQLSPSGKDESCAVTKSAKTVKTLSSVPPVWPTDKSESCVLKERGEETVQKLPSGTDQVSPSSKGESCVAKESVGKTVQSFHPASAVLLSPEKETKAKFGFPLGRRTSSLTSVNERDKLKALFSVRRGGIKLTSRAASSEALKSPNKREGGHLMSPDKEYNKKSTSLTPENTKTDTQSPGKPSSDCSSKTSSLVSNITSLVLQSSVGDPDGTHSKECAHASTFSVEPSPAFNLLSKDHGATSGRGLEHSQEQGHGATTSSVRGSEQSQQGHKATTSVRGSEHSQEQDQGATSVRGLEQSQQQGQEATISLRDSEVSQQGHEATTNARGSEQSQQQEADSASLGREGVTPAVARYPCVRLEQDPSGITDVSITMDISSRERDDAPGEEADAGHSSEDEFLTTCFSLMVPKNKMLDITFEPVVNSQSGLDDKDIEIEVNVESEGSMEGIKVQEILSTATRCVRERLGVEQVDTVSEQEHSRSDIAEDSLPEETTSLETEVDQEKILKLSEKVGHEGDLEADQTSTDEVRQCAESRSQTGSMSQAVQEAPAMTESSAVQSALEHKEVGRGSGAEGTAAGLASDTGQNKSAGDLELTSAHSEMELSAAVSFQTEVDEMMIVADDCEEEECVRDNQEMNLSSEKMGGIDTSAESYGESKTETTEAVKLASDKPEDRDTAAESHNESQATPALPVTVMSKPQEPELSSRTALPVTPAGKDQQSEAASRTDLPVTPAGKLQEIDPATPECRHQEAELAAPALPVTPPPPPGKPQEAPELASSRTGSPCSPPCLTHCNEESDDDQDTARDTSDSTGSPPVLKPQTPLLHEGSDPPPSLPGTPTPVPPALKPVVFLSSETPLSPSMNPVVLLSPGLLSSAPGFSNTSALGGGCVEAKTTATVSVSAANYSPISSEDLSSGASSPEKMLQDLAPDDDDHNNNNDDDEDGNSSSGRRNCAVTSMDMSDEEEEGDDDKAVIRSGRKDCRSQDVLSAYSFTTPITTAGRRTRRRLTSDSLDMTDYNTSDLDNEENKSPVLDSQDSDDSFGDEPAFLSSVLGTSGPLSAVNENVPAQAQQGSPGRAQCPPFFSLDSLLKDSKKDEAEEKEALAMKEKLKKALLSGEINSQDENEDDDYDNFTDEQKNTLNKLKLEEEEICINAPGERVLQDSAWGGVFTEVVTPVACGVDFRNSDACLQHLFHGYHPSMLMDILSSEILSLMYHSLPCKSEFQRWLFFIMSVHSSPVEVSGCVNQLHNFLHWQVSDTQHAPSTWAPSLLDLVRIFVNWGADLKDLVFDLSTTDQEELKRKVQLEGNAPQQGVPAECHRNFQALLKMLTSWLQARPGYSTEELSQLLLMLCRLSLDPSLGRKYVLTDLQMCLASILECYQPNDWNSVVPWLCHKLAGLSGHHHNQVSVAQLLSTLRPRCRYLQQRLAYLLLHSTLHPTSPTTQQPGADKQQQGANKPESVADKQESGADKSQSGVDKQEAGLDKQEPGTDNKPEADKQEAGGHHLSDAQIHQFQLGELLDLVKGMKPVVRTDNYHTASIVQLLDLCVGPAAHYVTQRKQLFQLLEALKLIVPEIKDSMQRLDCTKVKDMLLNLCMKWELAIKVNINKTKQRKLFGYASSFLVPVEKLTDQGPAANDDDDTTPSIEPATNSDNDNNNNNNDGEEDDDDDDDDTTAGEPEAKVPKREHRRLLDVRRSTTGEDGRSRDSADSGSKDSERAGLFETFSLDTSGGEDAVSWLTSPFQPQGSSSAAGDGAQSPGVVDNISWFDKMTASSSYAIDPTTTVAFTTTNSAGGDRSRSPGVADNTSWFDKTTASPDALDTTTTEATTTINSAGGSGRIDGERPESPAGVVVRTIGSTNDADTATVTSGITTSDADIPAVASSPDQQSVTHDSAGNTESDEAMDVDDDDDDDTLPEL